PSRPSAGHGAKPGGNRQRPRLDLRHPACAARHRDPGRGAGGTGGRPMTRRARGRNHLLLAALAVLVAALCLASLLIGPSGLSARLALPALLGQGDPMLVLVMQEVRLPRALLAVMVGAALGLSGAVLQGFLRNPLAEPGLIGTSASAALGAVLAIHTGLAAAWAPGLP